ncbi:microcystin dependent MdpB family protein [Azorhizobium oxalatiphilum]|uniref:Microcystin dependent MdpB family protein n=1 Tax=Azorhizobium oxalatiphilum TaxID=980631 RepID=A0A917C0Q0_9HYPH|nr:tail fiber protein [Azorhizobium oxalatiphilum]GGF66176.1 microcystin dependent MdpB family protein [Azorhizobium oxalatiphilum]
MNPYLGEIRLTAGDYAPKGWALCNGQVLPTKGNEALYGLVGSYYGGDGRTTFALPDMRGRLPIGRGQRPGTEAYALGQSGGAETVILEATHLPAHTHRLAATTTPASLATPTEDNVMLGSTVSEAHVYNTMDEGVGDAEFSTLSIGSAAQGPGHDNLMPAMALNYIICISGGLMPQAT